MAVSHRRVTVSTSAVALNTASTAGKRLTVKNTSANAVDLGVNSVTAAAGFDLAAGASATITLQPGDVLYAIRSGASDGTVAIVET